MSATKCFKRLTTKPTPVNSRVVATRCSVVSLAEPAPSRCLLHSSGLSRTVQVQAPNQLPRTTPSSICSTAPSLTFHSSPTRRPSTSSVHFQLTRLSSWLIRCTSNRKSWKYYSRKGTSQLQRCIIGRAICRRWMLRRFSLCFIINKGLISNIWQPWNWRRMAGNSTWDSKHG